MLRISKQVDYGILLLTSCARGPAASVHNARDLAEATGLPLPMVGKVLKRLARDEILTSHRGTKGGYSLARDAKDISVASIVQALEGPIHLVDCASDDTDRCRLRGECDVVAPLRSLARAVRELFERVTLDELLAGCGSRIEDHHRTDDSH
jgi:FeS assembly SUF system regulator